MENQDNIMHKISNLFIDYVNAVKNSDIDKTENVVPITDSNMNLVLKINLQNKEWIIKHGQPWVRKYPHISAPENRTFQEAMFYRSYANHQDLKQKMPKFVGYNQDKNILALEFIDGAQSGMDFYFNPPAQGLSQDILLQGVDYLSILHQMNPPPEVDWSNKKLRQLNHAHIFVLPLEIKSLLDLDAICPGLEDLRSIIIKNDQLKRVFRDLGESYLNSIEGVPLHGDMYPGSCLFKNKKLIVIDPEFCFIGPAEFDLGVFMAHHLILGGDIDDIKKFVKIYKERIGNSSFFDLKLCQKFVGIEIIRRCMGVAQLPIKYSLERYSKLTDMALTLCLEL